ncbi:MAG: hypothetical protein ACRDZ3_13170 [Acidimicrobiia bacterium]
MIPKIVTDAGYTAVGLGVLAAQQVQTRRRETRSRVRGQIYAGRQTIESAVGQVKARIEPLQAKLEPLGARLEPLGTKIKPLKDKVAAPVASALDHLPHLPGPVGGLVASGRDRIQSALRPGKDQEPPARHADQGAAEETSPPAEPAS